MRKLKKADVSTVKKVQRAMEYKLRDNFFYPEWFRIHGKMNLDLGSAELVGFQQGIFSRGNNIIKTLQYKSRKHRIWKRWIDPA